MREAAMLNIVNVLAVAFSATAAAAGPRVDATSVSIERKICQAPDGVTIVYSAAGAGETALVFIHGGLADRTFFDGQLKTFADRYRVIALDLAGHGESGTNRTKWGLPEFGADVKAVVDAEKLKRVILFGNSLGGPTAIEAALLLPSRVIGVVGIDTFQSLDHLITPEDAHQRAETFRADYSGRVKNMTKRLFHADADPVLVADAERRMLKTSPVTAYNVFMSLAGYDHGASVRKLTVPLRTINGDIYRTRVPLARRTKADFDAVVMKHMGHYPMLERPDEFNRHVVEVVQELSRGSKAP
ncbi:MAG: alpha/beta fold hydrolase [Planctomycetota bacterium]|jgi:pimeloyl-ACP methyl ester carboxylesterase